MRIKVLLGCYVEMIGNDRRFGTIYWSDLQGVYQSQTKYSWTDRPSKMGHFSWTARPMKMGPISCSETSVSNYQSWLDNIPESIFFLPLPRFCASGFQEIYFRCVPKLYFFHHVSCSLILKMKMVPPSLPRS
jgi:hypothetical protein